MNSYSDTLSIDYTGTLLFSTKGRSKRKNGKLKYYKCNKFDGKSLFVEEIKSPPVDKAIANSGRNRFQWYIHNLDILAEKYNIIYQNCISVSEEDADAN